MVSIISLQKDRFVYILSHAVKLKKENEKYTTLMLKLHKIGKILRNDCKTKTKELIIAQLTACTG